MRRNLILAADAYTIAGNCLVSPAARQRSCYYMANRTSPAKAFGLVNNDKMIMWGLSNFILNNLNERVNCVDLVDAIEFMGRAHITGGPLKFDHKMWDRVIRDYRGVLPIRIEGLPEGAVFYPHQPMVRVTSAEEGFGEVAAHIEALLVGTVSIGTARATLTAHLYEFMLERMKEYNPSIKDAKTLEGMAANCIHDFGMRASSCYEESELLGMAHLLFFNGTDTFNAAGAAYFDSFLQGEQGRSILALAHRVVQSYENEQDAYENLMNQDFIGSYVADCYNYRRAVVKYLIPMAVANPHKHIVARPDSGDACENALFAVKEAIAAGLSKNGPDGIEPTNFTIIEGNTVTPAVIVKIYRALKDIGVNPTKWIIFGIGGWLRNSVNRDVLSSAYKLCSVGSGKDIRPVMKFSETPEKESIPGPFKLFNRCCAYEYPFEQDEVCRIEDVALQHTDLVTYYDGSLESVGSNNRPWTPRFVEQGHFALARQRANYQWNNSPDSISREQIVGEMQARVKLLKEKYCNV